MHILYLQQHAFTELKLLPDNLWQVQQLTTFTFLDHQNYKQPIMRKTRIKPYWLQNDYVKKQWVPGKDLK